MSQHAAQREAGPMLAAITREIVKLHAAHYGKGPTKARAPT